MKIGNDTTIVCIARWAFFGLILGASLGEISFSADSALVYVTAMAGTAAAVSFKLFFKES